MPGRLRDRRGVGWLPVAFPGDVLVLSRWHVDPKSSRRPTPAPSKSFAACSPTVSLSPSPLPGVSGVPPSVDFTSPPHPLTPHPLLHLFVRCGFPTANFLVPFPLLGRPRRTLSCGWRSPARCCRRSAPSRGWRGTSPRGTPPESLWCCSSTSWTTW